MIEQMQADRHQAHIAGRWQGGADDLWLAVHDPADWDRVVGSVPALSAEMISDGYTVAREGAKLWAATGALARAEVLFRTARILRDRAEELTVLLSSENGKTLAEARVEVAKSAEFFDYYASLARLPAGDILNDVRPDTTVTVRHVPVGVILAITPWNDPLLTPARKLAPALAAGNAVVLKPASDTPLIALALTRALLDAGLPAAALATVTGRAGEVGEALLSSDEIDAVTFTGSTEVGLRLQRALAGSNLRVQTEMGGKNASIILADADVELAATTVAAAAFGQGGQRCTATSRVLVAEPVRDRFVELLVEYATAVRLGPGLDPHSQLGPLINPGHRAEVFAHIEGAIGAGARMAVGGGPGVPGAGCFVEPTVLVDVDTNTGIWRDEVFGPVVALTTFDDLDTAIRLANDSRYGLSAALFTRSLRDTEIFLRDIQTGQASVNLPTSGWDVHHPFGGFKLSGSSFKEQGLDALSFYMRTKTCAVRAV